jgi:hypothetical protein
MSESFSSDVYVPAPDGILREIEARDPRHKVMKEGCCNRCGMSLAGEKWARCNEGCILCVRCVCHHLGVPYCRLHFEREVGDKQMLKAGRCLTEELPADLGLSISKMTRSKLSETIERMAEKGYVKVEDFLFFTSIKITADGQAALESMTRAFKDDDDVVKFFSKLAGEVPGWRS